MEDADPLNLRFDRMPIAGPIVYDGAGESGTSLHHGIAAVEGVQPYPEQGKGYAAGKYRAWFTGMAPIENPRIIVAVMVDEPSAGTIYGGTVAAPVFSGVVQQTLRLMGVQPDMEVKPLIVANPVEEPSL